MLLGGISILSTLVYWRPILILQRKIRDVKVAKKKAEAKAQLAALAGKKSEIEDGADFAAQPKASKRASFRSKKRARSIYQSQMKITMTRSRRMCCLTVPKTWRTNSKSHQQSDSARLPLLLTKLSGTTLAVQRQARLVVVEVRG
jgi:hypothetical protein